MVEKARKGQENQILISFARTWNAHNSATNNYEFFTLFKSPWNIHQKCTFSLGTEEKNAVVHFFFELVGESLKDW